MVLLIFISRKKVAFILTPKRKMTLNSQKQKLENDEIKSHFGRILKCYILLQCNINVTFSNSQKSFFSRKRVVPQKRDCISFKILYLTTPYPFLKEKGAC